MKQKTQRSATYSTLSWVYILIHHISIENIHNKV